MAVVADFCRFLEDFAPHGLSESWDNVGLLVGDRLRSCERVMTCLTITPATTAEAIREGAQLIVAHHPLPFQPLKRLTTETTVGRMLLDLIEAKIAVYSPHTAFDSAAEGINQGLAEGLGLVDIQPFAQPADPYLNGGTGRWGRLTGGETVADLVLRLKSFLKIDTLQMTRPSEQPIERVAIGCGSAGKFLEDAIRRDCRVFVTGEASFHTCLEAEARGVTLLLPGHYASERFGLDRLAAKLSAAYPAAHIWAATEERDPLRSV